MKNSSVELAMGPLLALAVMFTHAMGEPSIALDVVLWVDPLFIFLLGSSALATPVTLFVVDEIAEIKKLLRKFFQNACYQTLHFQHRRQLKSSLCSPTSALSRCRRTTCTAPDSLRFGQSIRMAKPSRSIGTMTL